MMKKSFGKMLTYMYAVGLRPRGTPILGAPMQPCGGTGLLWRENIR